MIQNATVRALIAAAVFVAALWLLRLALLAGSMTQTVFQWAAFIVALALAIAVFIGLARPARRPGA
jgi:purine-cytosine permease-like protein